MALELREKMRRRMANRDQVYILPTRSGLLFMLCVAVLVLIAATYNNNLIYAQAFLLSSIFVISMLQTHFNLMGTNLEIATCEEVFEGEVLTLNFRLRQRRAGRKFQLQVRSLSKQWVTVHPGRENMTPHDLSKPISLVIQAWKRGVHPIPTICLESRYPLGLFRAWKVFRFTGELVVYPKPEGARQIDPTISPQGDAELGLRLNSEGDFGELKPYRTGESYHQIAWKHYARSGELYTKVHWGEDNRHYKIPWSSGDEEFEKNLSQMSLWIRRALDENATFEMELPNGNIEPGYGFEQARICWRALASVKEAA